MHSIEPPEARNPVSTPNPSRHALPASAPAAPHSVPRYVPLRPHAPARSHLVVAQGNALDALPAFVGEVSALPGAAMLVTHGNLRATGLPTEFHASIDALEDEVRRRLNDSAVGLHLYVCGDEAFIWRIRRVAHALGMLPEEIHATVSGARRTVYCVHCSASHPHDALDEVTCPDCGVRLSVRPHFSARLGGYFGVCADADRPYAGDDA